MPPLGKRSIYSYHAEAKGGPVRDMREWLEPSHLSCLALMQSSQQNDLSSEEPQELSMSRLTPLPSSSKRVVAQVSGRRA